MEKGKHSDRGDIVAKYHPAQYIELKEEGINLNIFAQADVLGQMAKKFAEGDDKGAEALAAEAEGDDFFEMDGEVEETKNVAKPKESWKTERAKSSALNADDIDVDAI